MPQPIEDDLFRESTMTFGEHLEELRACLFKSVVGLMIGLIFGLYPLGKYVVQYIQTPLSDALTAYYQKESVERVNREMEEMESRGQPLPWTDEELKRRVEQESFLAEEVFIDPVDLLRQLKIAFPKQFGDADPPKKFIPAEQNAERAKAKQRGDDLIRLFLWRPSEDDPRLRTKSLSAQEAFMVYIKASLLVGVLLASPWIFYQIWHFVAAGLYPHERRYVHLYLPISLGLFLLGAALAFNLVFEPVLSFLLSFNKSLGIDPDPRINEWLGFVMMLPIGFGIGFQLPLVMLFLNRIGVFTVHGYLSQWKIAIFVIFVLSAFLTPPDPSSMMLLAAPLTMLYFGGVLLCKLLPRKAGPYGDGGE
ncbi:MAG: twin-arginine translocase subunit TatC [Pirellulales bacterium]|nr:twin-arginine translocase subunit TatC [Pirellulales bacterium]